MKKVLIALSILGCALPSTPAQSDESLIRETVLPLPESLRAGAEVIQYEEGTRKKVIRKGTNGWICAADDPVTRDAIVSQAIIAEGIRHNGRRARVPALRRDLAGPGPLRKGSLLRQLRQGCLGPGGGCKNWGWAGGGGGRGAGIG